MIPPQLESALAPQGAAQSLCHRHRSPSFFGRSPENKMKTRWQQDENKKHQKMRCKSKPRKLSLCQHSHTISHKYKQFQTLLSSCHLSCHSETNKVAFAAAARSRSNLLMHWTSSRFIKHQSNIWEAFHDILWFCHLQALSPSSLNLGPRRAIHWFERAKNSIFGLFCISLFLEITQFRNSLQWVPVIN